MSLVNMAAQKPDFHYACLGLNFRAYRWSSWSSGHHSPSNTTVTPGCCTWFFLLGINVFSCPLNDVMMGMMMNWPCCG